ncbi:dTDP-4-dehydrorhamnose 3,5-epimerase [Mariprofundus ferrinatatus]
MRILACEIDGVYQVESSVVADSRGRFARLYCEDELAAVLMQRKIVQVNRSLTHKCGAVRGLHFQYPPHAEMKLVRCLKGRVWDVAVDLRAGSPTFLKWTACELSPENGRMMVIQEGCAHGFQVLEPDSELLYLHTAAYTPESEGAVRFDDPAVAIVWPLPVSELSERDRNHPLLDKSFQGLMI